MYISHRDGTLAHSGPAPSRRGRGRALSLVAVVIAATAGAVVAAAPAQAATAITINGTSGGRVFDGVGAISGGGGNSRLLIDYPEPPARPDPGLPVQAGLRRRACRSSRWRSAATPTPPSGAEPSHEHTRGDVNCNRGYEWWLMEQAKARNPNIKLVGPGLGRARLDRQRQLLVHRRDQLPDRLAGLRHVRTG